VFIQLLDSPKAIALSGFPALRIFATKLGPPGACELPMLLLALVPVERVLSIKPLFTIRA